MRMLLRQKSETGPKKARSPLSPVHSATGHPHTRVRSMRRDQGPTKNKRAQDATTGRSQDHARSPIPVQGQGPTRSQDQGQGLGPDQTRARVLINHPTVRAANIAKARHMTNMMIIGEADQVSINNRERKVASMHKIR
jgi:hypothetical protein